MRGKKVAQVLYKNKNRFGRMGITRLGIFLTSGLADRKATRICGPAWGVKAGVTLVALADHVSPTITWGPSLRSTDQQEHVNILYVI